MASTPKQANGNSPSNNNGPGEKRKKSKGKGTYLSKWLEKTMRDIQQPPPNLELYDSFINSNVYPIANSQFPPGYNPYKYNTYGCAPEPMSLPSLPTYYNSFVPPPYSDYPNLNNQNGTQAQRRHPLRRNNNKAEEVASFPADNVNLKPYLELKHFSDSQDYASLPPIVTSMGDTNSNSDFHEQNDKDDSNNTRRFSDPCVQGLPDVERQTNGDDSDSGSSSGLSGSQVGSRLLSCLLDQIAALKVANGRLTKELQETRAELESLRQNGYFPKSSGNLGAASTLNSNGQYSPGCVTELVREIRDATRIREEAMYARLRAMVIERTDSGLASAESKLADRTLDEIKSSLRASEADKRLMMDRILKLEDELRHLRLTGSEESRVNGNEEDDRTRMKRELTEMRRSKQNAEEHSHKWESNMSF